MHISEAESSKLLSKDMLSLRGKGNRAGRTVGKTWVFVPEFCAPSTLSAIYENEEALFFASRRTVLSKLRRLYGEFREESDCAWIFLMQISLLSDNLFTELPRLYLSEGKSAAQTVLLCRDYFYSVLCKKEGGENLVAVSPDIDDISLRLISELRQGEPSAPPPQTIMLCRTPPVSYIAEWRELLCGIVTEEECSESHHAALALSLGIPYVSVRDELSDELSDRNALIDSECGHLYVNPDLATLSRFADAEHGRKKEEEKDIEITSRTILRENGKKMLVLAELNKPSELSRLSERYCDGIGKFTSEELYLEEMCLPDEELLFEEYRRAAEMMPTKPIIIRGFKTLGTVHLESVISENTLGESGELYVLYDSTLRTQLRAVMRAAVYGSLQFLLVQNDRYSDISQCASLMEELSAELYEEDREFTHVPLGSIIDSVSSALMCDKIIEECDFVVVDTEKLSRALCENHLEDDPHDSDNMYLDALTSLVGSISKVAAKKKKGAILSLGKNCSPDIFPPSLLCEFFAVSAALENLTKLKKAILEPAKL